MFALEAASTDPDKTGQIIWQAARVFSGWMAQQGNGERLFSGQKVLELGAGPGLTGFHVAHWAKEVIVSDYQELVMDLLHKNINECNPRPQEC